MYVYKYLNIKKCVFMSGGGAEWNGVERNRMEWIGMKRIGNLWKSIWSSTEPGVEPGVEMDN